MEDQKQVLCKIIEHLDSIENKLDRILSAPMSHREVVPDAVTVAILGGPDALLEFNKRERAKKLRANKRKKEKAQTV